MSAPPFPEVLPVAWMGYANQEDRDKRLACIVVRVCCYCPDKQAADDLAKAHGWGVTHGICSACSQRQMRRILGEKDEDS